MSSLMIGRYALQMLTVRLVWPQVFETGLTPGPNVLHAADGTAWACADPASVSATSTAGISKRGQRAFVRGQFFRARGATATRHSSTSPSSPLSLPGGGTPQHGRQSASWGVLVYSHRTLAIARLDHVGAGCFELVECVASRVGVDAAGG